MANLAKKAQNISVSTTPEQYKKKVSLFIYAGLIAATLIAYEPVRHNGFINYDDDKYITENPDVSSGLTQQSIIQTLTQPQYFMWHPLTTISHKLDCELFGLNPLGHHLVSVMFHIINALLLFWILTNITGATWPSAFVAAVFALHPLQVESVAWAAERKTVLSGLFWLLTMAVYIQYTRRPNISRYILVFLVFGLCIMTKPVVVTLPLALLLLDYWPLDRVGKVSAGRLIIEKIPLLILSAILCVMTLKSLQHGEIVVNLKELPFDSRVANAFISYISYIGKILWPSGLAILYPYSTLSISDAAVIICAFLFTVITVTSVYLGYRRKYLIVGWLWFAGTIIPMSGLVQSGGQAMANRYMYISMLGLLIIIAWSVKNLIASRPGWKYAAVLLATAALSSTVILTRMQVKYWQNSITLFEHNIEITKDNALAENNLGCALFEARRPNEAIPHLQKAIRLIPDHFDAHILLGRILIKQEKFNEAIACLSELLKYNKNSAMLYYNLGVAFNNQNKYDEAIKHFDKALSLDANYPDARYRMGMALMITDRNNEAIACFNEVLRQNDNFVDAHYNLAIALGKQKEYDQAIEHLAKVLRLNPTYPDAHNKMGFAFMQAGKYDLAVENLTRAIELKPDNIDVLNKLGWLLAAVDDASIHNAQKAVEFAQRGCKLTGYNDPMLLDTLAVAYAAAGRFDEAKATAEKALSIAEKTGRGKLAGEIQNRIKLYQAEQPYRQK